ncbi:MAG: ATP-binding cassette domain-containing protein [Pseudomonadales bacterium]|jgi:ATP-binding cassette subfamily F protein 3|nr:ATP-binding cassette domain-containing protein [Pseudomonadales bacterium]
MLTFSNLHCRRGEKVILDGASFTVHAGQHVGLVGSNGVGKSTLFELIRGRLVPEDGDVLLADSVRIAHLAQHTPDSEREALQFVLDGDVELRRVQQDIERAEAEGAHERLGTLHARLDALDGYTAEARAGQILHGLGFRGEDFAKPVSAFSGGWRMRLALARTLMQPADLLLLDEPTNHLDLDATLWLERWLGRLDCTLLLISHDRDFLDRTVHYVAHLEQQTVTIWRGNYSHFERQRAEALANQQATYEKHQKRMAEIQRFVDRFRAKATKARQVQSRLKTLEELSRTAAVHARSPFRFTFRDPVKMSAPLAEAEDVALGYRDDAGEVLARVLDGVEFRIEGGARIGLLGPNGAGKSTLVKTLARSLAPLEGEIVRGHHAPVAWFAQHQMELLRPERSPLDHLLEADPEAREQDARNHLGGFGFGAEALDPVRYFSGGERARVVLALLAWQRPALLLLDEPTNHLDIEMREALALALGEFAGAVLLVSHDRHLLRETCDEFWLVAEGRVQPWTGDLEDYARWLLDRDAPAEAEGVEQAAPAREGKTRAERQAEKRAEAERRKQLKPLRDEIVRLERAMEQQQVRLAEIEAALADEGLYEDARREEMTALLQEQGELRSALETAEEDWLHASARYEARAQGDEVL